MEGEEGGVGGQRQLGTEKCGTAYMWNTAAVYLSFPLCNSLITTLTERMHDRSQTIKKSRHVMTRSYIHLLSLIMFRTSLLNIWNYTNNVLQYSGKRSVK